MSGRAREQLQLFSEARLRGLRIVPREPSPAAFPPRPCACDVRPRLCAACVIDPCPFGQGLRDLVPKSSRAPR